MPWRALAINDPTDNVRICLRVTALDLGNRCAAQPKFFRCNVIDANLAVADFGHVRRTRDRDLIQTIEAVHN